MIRYEIYSNVATSEQGLRSYPVLQDLADSLAVKDIETRYVKHVARVESEINVASGQFAKGLTVRETAVKTLQPQTSLKGCLTWLKSVTARVDRGLHLDVERARSTNGAGLVLGQLFARGQKAFLTGMEEGNWQRLTAQPDITLKKIPPEIAKNETLRNEYRARGTRPASFFGVLEQMVRLHFLPADFRTRISELLKTRDAEGLTRLSEEQIINVGLISDALERYQNLLEQFFALVETGALGGDLPPLFSFLTQGIEFPLLHKVLSPFALENKRNRIRDKRGLVNEIRIGLSKSDSAKVQQFQSRFTSLVIRERALRDPALFKQTVRLEAADPEETEVMGGARQSFRELEATFGKLAHQKIDPSTPAPSALKQMLFEMVVGLTYQAEFTVQHRQDAVPKRATLARHILSAVSHGAFDMKLLRSLSPKLPPRGVARNLSGKIPLTMEQFSKIMATLRAGLLPMGGVAEELSKTILAKYKNQEAQEKTAALNAYLHNAYPILRNTNYLLGNAGQTPVMRGAALAAGRGLGLTVLSARDQIRNRELLAKMREDPDQQIEGYVALMTEESRRFIPLKADLDFLARAYRFLFTERVVYLVRRFASKKISYLLETYGSGLFEAVYQHLVWERQTILSRYQLGMILYRQKVFDVQRLKEFGFQAGGMDNGHERDNPWLHAKDESGGEERSDYPFVPGRIEKEYQANLQGFSSLVERCGEQAKSNGAGEAPTVAAVISTMAKEGRFDLMEEEYRTALANSAAAKALWTELQEIAGKNFQEIVGQQTDGEAIEFTFPGPFAYLTLLKDSQSFKINGQDLLFRLRAGPDKTLESVSGRSQVLLKGLREKLGASGGSESARLLKPALELLQSYDKAWGALRQLTELVLIDQMLQETILALAKPAPPTPQNVAKLPPEKIMCLGMSSSDVGKFHKLVPKGRGEDFFATLSQLASWLIRFPRMREELEDYRDIIKDVLDIIASSNISVFDAPHILRYGEKLRELHDALSIRPEDIDPEDLSKIERTALETEQLVREIFETEQAFAPKDRWLNRILIRLKQLRSNLDLYFVHRLYERAAADRAAAEAEEEEGEGAQAKRSAQEQFQTFTERVRNVIEARRRITRKSVFVVSPGSSQRRLTLTLIDQLFGLKGLYTPVLTDIAGCANFVDDLRTRLPPHRMFNMNRI
jgi:hypothetical protein